MNHRFWNMQNYRDRRGIRWQTFQTFQQITGYIFEVREDERHKPDVAAITLRAAECAVCLADGKFSGSISILNIIYQTFAFTFVRIAREDSHSSSKRLPNSLEDTKSPEDTSLEDTRNAVGGTVWFSRIVTIRYYERFVYLSCENFFKDFQLKFSGEKNKLRVSDRTRAKNELKWTNAWRTLQWWSEQVAAFQRGGAYNVTGGEVRACSARSLSVRCEELKGGALDCSLCSGQRAEGARLPCGSTLCVCWTAALSERARSDTVGIQNFELQSALCHWMVTIPIRILGESF